MFSSVNLHSIVLQVSAKVFALAQHTAVFRWRADNSAQIRQSRPCSGPGLSHFQYNTFETIDFPPGFGEGVRAGAAHGRTALARGQRAHACRLGQTKLLTHVLRFLVQ